ncbi:MAG TPA: MBOAT family protein [Bryobacteraceae bacterium]|jgi:alginate O-acetyltransferase complex protein AlgI|nr:MBOAT family protein [Bryobacteraceae bacterium]
MKWWRGWAPLIALPVLVLLLVPSEWPRWAFMWMLTTAVFMGCKWLTWRRAAVTNVPVWKHAAYLFLWPGLDAAGFLAKGGVSNRALCRPVEWFAAAGKLALGLVLLFGVARLIPRQLVYIIGWTGMISVALILHFGAFHLLSCWWRSMGVEARPLMNRPSAPASLSEFWGRRWNTAFRDLTYRFLFRPFTSWFGPRWGMLAGFLFSGAVHDLVISVPARGGYGGPTIFFAVQGAAMMAERSAFGRRIGLGSGWSGRVFTFLVLLVPVGLLFHRPFVEGIIVPFMRALGAI